MNVPAFYNRAAAQYAKFRRPQREFEIIDHFLSRSGKRILEVGCGTGDVARQMASKGKEVTAIDLSAEMIRIAASMQVEGCSFHVADICQFDLSTGFDGALLLYSLIHYPKDEAVDILRRVSAASSTLLVAMHGGGAKEVSRTFARMPSGSYGVLTLYLWPLDELHQVLLNLGLSNIEMFTRQPESHELPFPRLYIMGSKQ